MGRKTIFITGASSGIGRATAELAAGRDWNVALFARRGDRLADLARDLGDAALALEGDVTRPDDLERAIAATVTPRRRGDNKPRRTATCPRRGEQYARSRRPRRCVGACAARRARTMEKEAR